MARCSMLLAFAGLFFIISCQNTPTPPATAVPAAEIDVAKPKPDPNDLLRLLQGRWQSETDPTYILEIVDSKMHHLNGGKLTEETSIEVDGNCQSQVCKIDSVMDLSDGWCFVEKAQMDVQCNFVIRCDTARLEYRAIGSAGAGLAFKKLR